MPRCYVLQMEDRFPLIDSMEQTPPIPEIASGPFFADHDEPHPGNGDGQSALHVARLRDRSDRAHQI